ncbi:glycine--tRNA ligase subunit beta, partial [Limosilactobacillus mucosae]|nr:glycine--tRNA ligase subunit beta [Limosilactobacillus mucosae]
GKPVDQVLPGLKNVIESMNFPTMMKWGHHSLQFVRPIRWLVSLLDDEVVPFAILDVTADRKTRGHRFLGHDIEIKNAEDYEAALHDDFVIANQKQRKALIKSQIDQILAENDWVIDWDEELLEEVNNLVEWPTSFAGSFDEKYLVLPEEVLITSMKDNQRFFCVRDHEGKLLPHFIAVRNGNSEYLENVIKGNERVLVPRLEDAKFFYEEDQKITIDQYVERLKKVSFHDKISSMYDKMARTAVLAQLLGQKLNFNDAELADLDRAAHIYKFDLTTQMVGEFSELQGIMGEIYAKLLGEKADVAAAIKEHYMPISAEGDLPESKIGAVLAIADKLDSIISFFAVDMIPSGSNDPYALRRQAYGIVRIIAARGWHLPVMGMADEFAAALAAKELTPSFDVQHNADQVHAFFLDRLKQFFNTQDLRYDVIDAVVDTKSEDVANVLAAAETIDAHKDDEGFKEDIEALTRVLRIAKKADFKDGVPTIDPAKFQNPSEKQLFDRVNGLNEKWADQTLEQNFADLRAMAPVITGYFEENMIMDKDEDIRNNRLALLKQLADDVYVLGNLDKLIVK